MFYRSFGNYKFDRLELNYTYVIRIFSRLFLSVNSIFIRVLNYSKTRSKLKLLNGNREQTGGGSNWRNLASDMEGGKLVRETGWS